MHANASTPSGVPALRLIVHLPGDSACNMKRVYGDESMLPCKVAGARDQLLHAV